MADYCVVSGALVDSSHVPVGGALVYASPINDSNIIFNTSTGYFKGIAIHPKRTTTGSDGSFSLNLTKNALFRVVIRYMGFDEVILVPIADTAVLWSLVGSKRTVLTSSTGDVITGGNSAEW